MAKILSKAQLKKLFGNEGTHTAADFEALIDTIVDKTILSLVAADVGLGVTSDPTFADVTVDSLIADTVTAESLGLLELAADPDDPDGGKSVIWMSDGTGAGDAGDIMMKISSPAGSAVATKTATLVDFSAV